MRAKKLFDATDDLTNSRRFIAALIILQTKAPVHYSVLLATDVIWTHAIPTAATDGIYVYINPDFFRGLASDDQRAFLLAHEVSHIILRHPQRGKVFQDRGFFRANVSFDHHTYNRAADYVINADLIATGFEPIPEGCYSDKYGRNDLVDAVYAELHNQPDGDDDSPDGPEGQPAPQTDQPDGQSGSQPAGQSDDQSDDQSDGESDGESGDDETADGSGGDTATDESDANDLPERAGHDHHLTPQYEGDDDEQADAAREDDHDLRSAVDDGLDQMQADGRDPSKVGKAIREGAHRYREGHASSTDWRSELADRFVRAGQGGQSTWSRIHRRRYATLGVISPTSIGTVGRISIVVDISGSVDRTVLNAFLTESAAMIDTLQPRDGVVILWTNTEVVRVDEVSCGSELLDLEAPMGGGTYLTAGVEWLEHNGLDSDLTLVFTDGYLMSHDWAYLGQCDDLVVVLDSQPHTYTQRDIDASGTDIIVAEAA